MKQIILIIGTILVIFNTLIGLVVVDYTVMNFLLADLSLALSAGILYFVVCSRMADGYKIGLTLFFLFTGIVRFLCVAFISSVLENNVLLLVAVGILLFELACVATALFASKKVTVQ